MPVDLHDARQTPSRSPEAEHLTRIAGSEVRCSETTVNCTLEGDEEPDFPPGIIP